MAKIDKATIFATGPNSTSGLDSLTIGNGSLWAEYGNGAVSTGGTGSSTIVQYSMTGTVENTYTIAGSVDGLKIDPNTGMVWALQNQDGNSTLSLINPTTDTVSAPLTYAVTSATSGYDDVVFENGQVYLSYTNPAAPGAPVVQQLSNGDQPQGTLVTSNILLYGATGTNIATGQTGQVIPLNDPDSLKANPNGGLILSSGGDNTIVLIKDVGTQAQSESFVTLTNLPTGSALDDVIIPTSKSGTFYVSNAGTNQIEAFKVSGLNTSDAYASVGTEIVQVDLQTGAQTVLVSGLQGAHGLAFVPHGASAEAAANPASAMTSLANIVESLAPSLAKDLGAGNPGKPATYANDPAQGGTYVEPSPTGAVLATAVKVEDQLKSLFAMHAQHG